MGSTLALAPSLRYPVAGEKTEIVSFYTQQTVLSNNALFSCRYASSKETPFLCLKFPVSFWKKKMKNPCLRRWRFLRRVVSLSLSRTSTEPYSTQWKHCYFSLCEQEEWQKSVTTKPLTWRGVPRPSSARPVGRICRFWSWWWPRGRPGPGRPRRWRRWTGSGRRAAAGGCQTRSPSAWCHASTTGRWLRGEKTELLKAGSGEASMVGTVWASESLQCFGTGRTGLPG